MKAIFRAEEPEHYVALTEMTAIWSRADQAASERRIKEFEANWRPSKPGDEPAEEAPEEAAAEAAPSEPAKKRGRPKKVVVDTIEETFDAPVEAPVAEPVEERPEALEPDEEFQPPAFLRASVEPRPVETVEAEPEIIPPATLEDVRSAFLELSAKRGPEAVVGLLSKFGSRKASDVAEADRGAIVREALALINA